MTILNNSVLYNNIEEKRRNFEIDVNSRVKKTKAKRRCKRRHVHIESRRALSTIASNIFYGYATSYATRRNIISLKNNNVDI